MDPGVSIILPGYNVAAHLPQRVGSVLSQTFSDWELITVDDGSRDGTLAWLQTRTYPRLRLRVHAQPDQGVSTAGNAVLGLARSQYAAFLDANDEPNDECNPCHRQHSGLCRTPRVLIP